MKISLNWLKDYVALDATVEEISRAITFLGFEVEQVLALGAPPLSLVVVGEVKVRAPHPNADRLSVCQVDIGDPAGLKTIVCGAQNYKVGDRVLVALPGAVLPGNFKIKQSKIRGQLSDGMMCSGKELGVGDDQSGLLILAPSTPLGTAANAVLPPGDTVFDLEITPNRPDCLCHLGIARELAAAFGQELKYPEVKGHDQVGMIGLAPAAHPNLAPLLESVRVDSAEDCPLYRAYGIAGVKIGPSPAWLQERLVSAGLRPVNNVVDVTNFVMLEYGQPLHAFDARKLDGRKIIVRRAADGEKIVTLDGKERTLSGRMLVIADAARPVVVAGIMGGENSGVAADTTDLVLECAVFKPTAVRWTARRLGLSSDSSYRFERGVDPHTAAEAAGRALDLIVATAGGHVVGPAFVVGGDIPWQREILLDSGFVRERLGFDVSDATMTEALESLELHVIRAEPTPGGTALTVSIPSWRGDLDRPIDLVEEILRIYGTEQIPPGLVLAPGLPGDDAPVVVFNRRATDYLVGHDFHECVNITLRASREMELWVSETAAQELALANPLVEGESHLRPTLVMGLLESLKLNRSRGVPVSRLAEIGRVFVESNGNNFECASVAFLVADALAPQWHRREPVDFYSVKHHCAALAKLAGIDLQASPLRPITGPYFGWQEGQAVEAGAIADGWTVRFGLLHLGMIRAIGIEGKVYAGSFSVLPAALPSGRVTRRYVDFSLFPPALRDLALVMDAATPAAAAEQELAAIARAAAGGAFALESLTVFDVYQGDRLPAGQKGIAFSLVFRAPDRTLTDDEVNPVLQKIQDALARTQRYTLRK